MINIDKPGIQALDDAVRWCMTFGRAADQIELTTEHYKQIPVRAIVTLESVGAAQDQRYAVRVAVLRPVPGMWETGEGEVCLLGRAEEEWGYEVASVVLHTAAIALFGPGSEDRVRTKEATISLRKQAQRARAGARTKAEKIAALRGILRGER
jgi:hypothetical protein